MGRVKLKIKRLENTNGRQATYAKRKHGIMKKANELSILCDIDIILLMFSPTGKPSLCSGKRSIEEVITKFAQLTPQERAKRKLESLEALRKTFKKLDHDVNIQEFLGSSSQTAEDLSSQSSMLQAQLSEIQKRLSYWTNPEKIDCVEDLGQMENLIRESLNQIQNRKENLQKQQQVMSLECTSQFQNGMIPFRVGAEQQLQPLPWIPNNDGQQLMLHDDSSYLTHRDVECSTNSSFGSYSGYYNMCRNPGISNPGQENGILNEISRTGPMSLQMGGQVPYVPYNLNVLSDQTFQAQAEMNPPENSVDYHVNGNFDLPRHGFETAHHSSWASTSGPYAVSMLDENFFPQQQN